MDLIRSIVLHTLIMIVVFKYVSGTDEEEARECIFQVNSKLNNFYNDPKLYAKYIIKDTCRATQLSRRSNRHLLLLFDYTFNMMVPGVDFIMPYLHCNDYYKKEPKKATRCIEGMKNLKLDVDPPAESDSRKLLSSEMEDGDTENTTLGEKRQLNVFRRICKDFAPEMIAANSMLKHYVDQIEDSFTFKKEANFLDINKLCRSNLYYGTAEQKNTFKIINSLGTCNENCKKTETEETTEKKDATETTEKKDDTETTENKETKETTEDKKTEETKENSAV